MSKWQNVCVLFVGAFIVSSVCATAEELPCKTIKECVLMSGGTYQEIGDKTSSEAVVGQIMAIGLTARDSVDQNLLAGVTRHFYVDPARGEEAFYYKAVNGETFKITITADDWVPTLRVLNANGSFVDYKRNSDNDFVVQMEHTSTYEGAFTLFIRSKDHSYNTPIGGTASIHIESSKPEKVILPPEELLVSGQSYSITELQKHRSEKAEYETEGFIVDRYQCPPCPKDALCKMCAPNHIQISEVNLDVASRIDAPWKFLTVYYDFSSFSSKDFVLDGEYRFHLKAENRSKTNTPRNQFSLISLERVDASNVPSEETSSVLSNPGFWTSFKSWWGNLWR